MGVSDSEGCSILSVHPYSEDHNQDATNLSIVFWSSFRIEENPVQANVSALPACSDHKSGIGVSHRATAPCWTTIICSYCRGRSLFLSGFSNLPKP